jgi:hypothetical protein
MALSYAQYVGDGVTTTFSVPFEYISRAHVSLLVDGDEVAFSWLSSTSVQAAVAPVVGSVVEVRRTTPRDTLLVNFVDGSVLVETDLDLSALQVFYLAQEAFDAGSATMSITADGSYSAGFRRITQVDDPVDPQDAVTYAWIVSTTNPIVTATTAARDAAQGYANDALGYRNAAQAAAAAAATFNPANFWTKVEADGRYSQLGHGHAIADVSGLQTALDGKAPASLSGTVTTLSATVTTLDTNKPKKYESGQLTISAAGSGTLTHNLGQKPDLVTINFVCLTAEGGFAVGEEFVYPTTNFTASSDINAGVVIVPNATDIFYRYGGSAASIIRHLRKDTGVQFALTPANWRMVIRAYKIAP